MTDKPVDLDLHRGMASQKATETRRLLAEVQAAETELRARQDLLEVQLLAAPAISWPDAAQKAIYLLQLFQMTPQAQDPRRQKLIANVLDDFKRLSGESSDAAS